MNGSLLRDAYDHHLWATMRLIDACLGLAPEQLATMVPGTYGSIIDTMRHTVGADAGYLSVLTAGQVAEIDETGMNFAAMRSVMEDNAAAWRELLAGDLDPVAVVVRHRDDGSESHAPLGIRLAQALHHGSDHRSQVCTALTALGMAPPAIDVWDFAESDGRLVVTEPA